MNKLELETKLVEKLDNDEPFLSEEDTIRTMYNVLSSNGFNHTLAVNTEEMAELIVKLMKVMRKQVSKNSIELIDAIADVQLSINQLKYTFGIDDKLLHYVEDIKREEVNNKIKNGKF